MTIRNFFDIALLAGLLITFPLMAETIYSDEQRYTPGILLVKIADVSQDDAAVRALFALGALEVKPLIRSSGKISLNSPLFRWRKVRFEQNDNLHELLDEISGNPLFENAELDGVITIH